MPEVANQGIALGAALGLGLTSKLKLPAAALQT